jgi:hypothetical protein
MLKSFRSHLRSVVAVFSASPRRFASTVMVGLLVLAAVAGPATPARADGETWTAQTVPEDSDWSSVAYGDGLWVAVASSGTYQVMTSPDGEAWTPRTSPVGLWNSVAYGGGLWVAVAYSGDNRVMTSTDPACTPVAPATSCWTAQTTGVEVNPWITVAYGNGLWVAVADGGDKRVMTSPDGINWTARTAALANSWKSVEYGVVTATGEGLWVAVAACCDGGTSRVMTSPDGEIWTAQTAIEVEWRSVAYGNGLWVAVADSGASQVMTSTNGINWTAQAKADESYWYSVAYGDGLWVAVANGYGEKSRVMTSPNGITWTAKAAQLNAWNSVAYGNGLWVAVASDGTNRVMTSGATFVEAPLAARPAAPSPPSVSCVPSPVVVGASVTCTVAGGDPGIDIFWQAAYNPPFAGAGVTLDGDGVGTFAFTVPAAALGQVVTVELVDWLAPVSLGVVGGPVPASVPTGGGPKPFTILLAMTGLLGLAYGIRTSLRTITIG